VLIMGLAGAGKSTHAAGFVAGGYQRLNRDVAGGSLRALLPALERAHAGGATRFVLDNTYLSRKSRAPVIEAAQRLGVRVRCVHLATSIEEAQVNVVRRMLARHGRLLAESELRSAAGGDGGVFAPTALFRMQRELEPPTIAEGFAEVETVAFERRWPAGFVDRALFIWCDATLDVAGARADVLRRQHDDGWRIIALSWQPEIAAGTRTAAEVEAESARLRQRIGLDIDVLYCPHGAGPPVCWCRKPLPGLLVQAIERHRLDPGRCLLVGDGPQDPGYARRVGAAYRAASAFFASV
jgi:hypothetical protein